MTRISWTLLVRFAFVLMMLLGASTLSSVVGPDLAISRMFSPSRVSAAPCPQPLALQNGGFESPQITGGYALLAASSVPGWKTTDSKNEIEIWKTGTNPTGIAAAEGTQFAEINANSSGQLYQDLNTSTLAGQTLTYSFSHRARQGTDTMALYVGVPGSETLVREVSTTTSGWVTYSGTVTIPAGQTTTRFAFRAISTGSGNSSVGNFVDNIFFGVPSCTVDLSVTKVGTPDPFIPGEPVTFTVTVKNTSTFDAVNANFDDVVPAQFTSVSWTCTASTGSSCGTSGGSGSGNTIARVVSIQSGGALTYVIKGTPSASAGATISNTAKITAPPSAPDSNPSNDSSTATLTRGVPALQLTKSSTFAGTLNPAAVGTTIQYRFAVTNTGTVSLTTLAITDPLPGLSAITCPTTSLAVGASTTCSASYTITQADVDRGEIANTATATAKPPGTLTQPTATSSYRITGERVAAIGLTKLASPAKDVIAGDVVTYSFTVTNSGNVTLSNVTVSDPLPNLGTIQCPKTTLAPGTSMTCTARYVVTQADVDAGSIANTATVNATPPVGVAAPTATSSTEVRTKRIASLGLQKSANYPGNLEAGHIIPFQFTVTNTGTVTLTNVSVTDPMPGLSAITCPTDRTLAPGATLVCTATYQITQADIDRGVIANTATTTAMAPPGVNNPTASDSITTPAERIAGISLDKTASPAQGAHAGDVIQYRFRVQNTGNVTLTQVAVLDEFAGLSSIACPQQSLAVGEIMTCTASYTVTQADVDRGSIANKATVTAQPPAGVSPPSATSSAVVTLSQSTTLSVVKTHTLAAFQVGQVMTFTIAVQNTGTVTLSNVTVSDQLAGISALACGADRTLSPGETLTCTATYILTQRDIDAGQVVNVARATGTPPGTLVAPHASDEDIVSGDRTSALSLSKVASPSVGLKTGDEVTYTYRVQNLGNVTLMGVTISDDRLSTIQCAGGSNVLATLAPGAFATCTATYAITQADVDAGSGDQWSITNVATASGNAPDGVNLDDATASATVSGSRNADLQVQKSAEYTAPLVAGSEVTYTFAIVNAGDVTLTNLALDDRKYPDLILDCDGGPLPSTLAPGARITCTSVQRISQGEIDANNLTNLVTVTAAEPGGGSVSDTSLATLPQGAPAIRLEKTTEYVGPLAAGDTVTYRFNVTNSGNLTLKAIAVSDPLPNLSPVTCPVTELAPGQSVTCTATYLVTQDDVDRGVIENTATVTANPPGTLDPVSDTDGHTIDGSREAGLALEKRAQPAKDVVAGTEVTYTFTLINTGNVTIRNITITDELEGLSGITCNGTTLAPGASTQCRASYLVMQADVDHGVIENTATVTGTPPDGVEAPEAEASTTVTARQVVAIELTKIGVAPNGFVVGELINYTLTVTNTGTLTATSLDVIDPLPGLSAIDCDPVSPDAPLAPGKSVTCTATYTVTQADIDAGQVKNTATATAGGYRNGIGPATDDATETVDGTREIGLTLDKAASPASGVKTGDVVTYIFRLQNTGNVTLRSAHIDDPLHGLSAIHCPKVDIAPGEIITCTATYAVTQADVDAGKIKNTATATADAPPGLDDPSATATTTVTTNRTPGLTVTKTSSETPFDVGQSVTYTFRIQNTGTVTLTGVTISDPLPGLSAITCPENRTLAPGESLVCTATYQITQADVDRGVVENTAVATGQPPAGLEPPIDTGGTTITGERTALIGVQKRASQTTGLRAGDTVTYTYEVRNDGNVTLTDLALEDDRLGTISCPESTLAPGGAMTCQAAYTITQADVDAGNRATWVITNVVTATGNGPEGVEVPPATATASVRGPRFGELSTVKTASYTAPVVAGTDVTYTVTVENTGTVTLLELELVDNTYGELVFDCDPDSPGTQALPESLAPGETATCTATRALTQADIDAKRTTNVATASGIKPNDNQFDLPVADDGSAVVTLEQNADLTIVKEAIVDGSLVDGKAITYTFEVRNTGNVTLTAVTVSDPLDGLSAVTCPGTELAPGRSMTCTATYTVTQADIDRGTIENTATVTAQPPQGMDPVMDSDGHTVVIEANPALKIEKAASNEPAEGYDLDQTVMYDFVIENTGNVTLTQLAVSDGLPGLSAITCPATELAPRQSVTCTATYVVTQDDVDRGVIENTAAVTANPPGDGQLPTAEGSEMVATRQEATLELTKEASPEADLNAGDEVIYTFTITNTGTVSLTNPTVTDPLPGLSAIVCEAQSLAPTVSTTCTATYTVTADDVANGSLINTAIATAEPPAGLDPPTSDGTTTITFAEPTPTPSPTPTEVPPTETPTPTPTPTEVPPTETPTPTPTEVPPTETSTPTPTPTEVPSTETPTPTPTPVPTETPTPTSTPVPTETPTPTEVPPTETPTPTPTVEPTEVPPTTVPSAGIRMEKSIVGATVAYEGDVITYRFTVTNTGEATLHDVTVSDPHPGLSEITPAVVEILAPGQSVEFTARYVVTADDVAAGRIDNTATVSATDELGREVIDDGSTAVAACQTVAGREAGSPTTEPEPTAVPTKTETETTPTGVPTEVDPTEVPTEVSTEVPTEVSTEVVPTGVPDSDEAQGGTTGKAANKNLRFVLLSQTLAQPAATCEPLPTPTEPPAPITPTSMSGGDGGTLPVKTLPGTGSRGDVNSSSSTGVPTWLLLATILLGAGVLIGWSRRKAR